MTEQESLSEFLNKVAGPIEAMFEDVQSIHPMWFVDNGTDLTIIATPWANQHEKQAAVTYVKNKMRELGAVRYAHLAEVWMLTGQKDVPESVKRGGSIASHPERREAVVILAEDKHNNVIQETRYIMRPEAGKATLSPPNTIHLTQDNTTGLLTGLLKD